MTKYNKMLRFLKDNGIYHSFKKNYFEQHDYFYDCYGIRIRTLNELCEKSNETQIIANSFQWDKTKEGYNFWNKAHDNFNGFLRCVYE